MGGQVHPAPYRRRAGRAGPLPHRHRRRGDLARAGRRRASWPACRCSSAAIRSRPASAILHHLSRLKEYGVTTFQAEDEIAAIAAAIGASFAGSLGVTSSSGPGIALKSEAMGLAIMTELPLVIVNSQRGGPSTGLPTKTEQSDLYQAVYGRNGDAPLPVIAARSPADAFDCAIEAVRIAVQYMTPVMLLTDGYIANAAEPWKVPDMGGYAPFPVAFHDEPPAEGEAVNPYARDDKLKRVWIKPGTPGLMHRIGGIEKNVGTGHIDYAPDNHQAMTDIRADKVLGVAELLPDAGGLPRRGGRQARGGRLGLDLRPDPPGRPPRARRDGKDVSHIHIRHIWPLPTNLGDLLKSYEQDHRAGDEQGPAQDPAPRPVSGRRPAGHQGLRPALQDRRDRGGDRGGAGE